MKQTVTKSYLTRQHKNYLNNRNTLLNKILTKKEQHSSFFFQIFYYYYDYNCVCSYRPYKKSGYPVDNHFKYLKIKDFFMDLPDYR